MKRTALFSLFAAVAAIGFAAATANAQLLYSTNFNTPTYADGGLIGQDGWLITGTSVVNPLAVANAATNGNVPMTNNGQDVNRPFTAVTDGSVFLAASINVSAALTGDYFMHLGDGGSSLFYARTYIQSSGAGYVMALGTSSGTAVTYGTTVLNFGTTYNVLARYDFVAGAGNDTGALFINPVNPLGIGDTPYVAATTIGTDSALISSANLRQGSATTAATLVIDNISVTAVPVPEPSTFVLGGLGLIGLGAAARRRKSA